MNAETEYAACLLMVGAPDFIAKHSRTNIDGPPVSTMGYRYDCNVWYNANARPQPHSLTESQEDFLEWWNKYKTWLVEVNRGLLK